MSAAVVAVTGQRVSTSATFVTSLTTRDVKSIHLKLYFLEVQKVYECANRAIALVLLLTFSFL